MVSPSPGLTLLPAAEPVFSHTTIMRILMGAYTPAREHPGVLLTEEQTGPFDI